MMKGSVEKHEHRPVNKRLEHDVELSGDEAWEQGDEEDDRLGVADADEETGPEMPTVSVRTLRWSILGTALGERNVSKPDDVETAHQLHPGKDILRGGDENLKTEYRDDDLGGRTERVAEDRHECRSGAEAYSLAGRKRDGRSGSHDDDHRRREKADEQGGIHRIHLSAWARSCSGRRPSARGSDERTRIREVSRANPAGVADEALLPHGIVRRVTLVPAFRDRSRPGLIATYGDSSALCSPEDRMRSLPSVLVRLCMAGLVLELILDCDGIVEVLFYSTPARRHVRHREAGAAGLSPLP